MPLSALCLFAGFASALAGTAAVNGPLFLRAGEDRLIAAPERIPDPVRWFAIEAIAGDYSNPKHCGLPAGRSCHAPIRYRRRPLPALDGKRSFHVAETPELTAPGTHRVVAGDKTQGEGVFGEEILAGAVTLAVRKDDSYVGFLTELIGVPFVYWPVEIPGLGHQTDALLGADCVAVVIYGRRRLGCDTRYYAPAALFKLARPVTPEPDGKPRVREGDILHFGFQTAVLAKDNPPIGELDENDLLIHAYHGLVEQAPLRRLPYRVFSHVVLRWPPCGEPLLQDGARRAPASAG
jgi:hypothetical protein